MKIPPWVFLIPYADSGRDRSGADCWGLILILYDHLDYGALEPYSEITLPTLRHRKETSEKLQSVLETQTQFEEVSEPTFADVILLNVKNEPLHIGFCLDKQTMIHTTKETGVVIEDFTGMKWINKIAGFYRAL